MVIALSPFLFFWAGDAALPAGFRRPPFLRTPRGPPPSVVISRALAGLLARGSSLGWPSRERPSGSSASLAAYSCGGSAGFSPASLLARDATRGAPKHLYLGGG